jgi:hypothetical protein
MAAAVSAAEATDSLAASAEKLIQTFDDLNASGKDYD